MECDSQVCLGVLGLHRGEGVRTVGRLHPGQAGERLLKQRPKFSGNCDLISTLLVQSSQGCECFEKSLLKMCALAVLPPDQGVIQILGTL